MFLDNNSTTQPLDDVVQAMIHSMSEGFGNPSSAHRVGERARKLVAQSRDHLAKMIGCRSSQIVFSSGATESNNWVFDHLIKQSHGGRVLSTGAEHSSVKERLTGGLGFDNPWSVLAIDKDGLVRLESLKSQIANAAFVSVHWANNETGVVQPIDKILHICRENSVPLHVDASQAVGKMHVDLSELELDFMTFTAHKFHGPQGIGALYCKDTSNLTPAYFGGGQESGLRPGTENLPGIVGFGTAAEIRQSKLDLVIDYLTQLRDQFERSVKSQIPNVFVNGNTDNRVCNTTNLRFEGVDGQALVAQLDANGIQCSQSSACTAQIPEPSYVLRAMGLSEEDAFSSVRFSFSELNTYEEVEKAVKILTKRVTALREFSNSYSSQD